VIREVLGKGRLGDLGAGTTVETAGCEKGGKFWGLGDLEVSDCGGNSYRAVQVREKRKVAIFLTRFGFGYTEGIWCNHVGKRSGQA